MGDKSVKSVDEPQAGVPRAGVDPDHIFSFASRRATTSQHRNLMSLVSPGLTGHERRSPRKRWHRAGNVLKVTLLFNLVRKRLLDTESLTPAAGRTGNHCAYLAKLRIGAKLVMISQSGGLATVLDNTRAVTAAATAAHVASSGQVIVQVASQAELVGTALWQQGDTTLSTEDMFKRRLELRHNPAVLDALQHFWDATLRSIRQCGRQETSLDFDGYTYLFERVYRVLLDEWDATDAHRTIADDWESDCKGGCIRLTREMLCDSLFELADTWCSSVNAEEYAEFLRSLLERVGTLRQPENLWYLWEDVEQVVFAPELAQYSDATLENVAPASPQVSPQPSPLIQCRDDGPSPAQPAPMVRSRTRMLVGQKERLRAVTFVQTLIRGHLAKKRKKQRKQAAQKITSMRVPPPTSDVPELKPVPPPLVRPMSSSMPVPPTSTPEPRSPRQASPVPLPARHTLSPRQASPVPLPARHTLSPAQVFMQSRNKQAPVPEPTCDYDIYDHSHFRPAWGISEPRVYQGGAGASLLYSKVYGHGNHQRSRHGRRPPFLALQTGPSMPACLPSRLIPRSTKRPSTSPAEIGSCGQRPTPWLEHQRRNAAAKQRSLPGSRLGTPAQGSRPRTSASCASLESFSYAQGSRPRTSASCASLESCSYAQGSRPRTSASCASLESSAYASSAAWGASACGINASACGISACNSTELGASCDSYRSAISGMLGGSAHRYATACAVEQAAMPPSGSSLRSYRRGCTRELNSRQEGRPTTPASYHSADGHSGGSGSWLDVDHSGNYFFTWEGMTVTGSEEDIFGDVVRSDGGVEFNSCYVEGRDSQVGAMQEASSPLAQAAAHDTVTHENSMRSLAVYGHSGVPGGPYDRAALRPLLALRGKDPAQQGFGSDYYRLNSRSAPTLRTRISSSPRGLCVNLPPSARGGCCSGMQGISASLGATQPPSRPPTAAFTQAGAVQVSSIDQFVGAGHRYPNVAVEHRQGESSRRSTTPCDSNHKVRQSHKQEPFGGGEVQEGVEAALVTEGESAAAKERPSVMIEGAANRELQADDSHGAPDNGLTGSLTKSMMSMTSSIANFSQLDEGQLVILHELERATNEAAYVHRKLLHMSAMLQKTPQASLRSPQILRAVSKYESQWRELEARRQLMISQLPLRSVALLNHGPSIASARTSKMPRVRRAVKSSGYGQNLAQREKVDVLPEIT